MSPSRLAFSLLVFSSLLAGFASAAVGPARSPAIAQAYDQFRDYYLGSSDAFAMRDSNEAAPDPSSSLRFAASLDAEGKWPDLDYASAARSGWPPAIHCTRLTAMAATAGRPGTSPAERATLRAATHRAFAYWISHDFQCPNWWFNQIGIPKAIGTIALLLGDDLAPAEYRYATEVSLARYPIAMTGQNKVWLAGNTLMRGLLAGDEALIRAATTTIWAEVNVSTAEGIQPDFSFHQHGAQLQFGNYGMAFGVETARWSQILHGTPWQLPPDKLAAFRGYLLDGQNWIAWRGAMDIPSCARQLMPQTPRTKVATVAHVMAQAASFDPEHAPAYQAYIARNQPGAVNDLVGDRYFWRSDYLVHRRPDFMATLKLSSRRVIGAELVNRENLSGYHNGDGALYLYREGGEYEDIFPVWDWRKLPGVTCAQTGLPDYKTSSVDREFVGGISDGQAGVAAIDYVRDGVRAHKAWFFAGDLVVCLGADISGAGPATVATTLNQCLLKGDVRVTTHGQTQAVGLGGRTLGDVDAVEHDGVRYTLLDGGPLHLQTGPVTGNWHHVFDNPETPNADVTADVFMLWLDHGVEPVAARYAYAVSPASSQARPRLIENSSLRQAVAMPDGHVGIVFLSAGEIALPDGRRLAVDAPCLVLASADGLRVVDPTQKRATIHLTIDGNDQELALPTGALAGTAVVAR